MIKKWLCGFSIVYYFLHTIQFGSCFKKCILHYQRKQASRPFNNLKKINKTKQKKNEPEIGHIEIYHQLSKNKWKEYTSEVQISKSCSGIFQIKWTCNGVDLAKYKNPAMTKGF